MAEHTEHVTVDAWAEDCIEGECEHVDEDGMPDDLSACASFQMEVCVGCQVERGLTSDPAWWEGALSPWPCEYVPEPAVPLMQHGPGAEPPKFKPQPADSTDPCPEWHCPDLSSEDRREGKTCPDHPCTCSGDPS